MNQVKGSLIKSRLNYIEKNASSTQKEEIMSLLTADQKQQLNNMIMVGDWYSIDTFIALHLAMDRVLGNGDKSLIPEIAAFCAEDALNGIYRFFYKVGSPEFIVKRAVGVWKQFYNNGSVEITIPSTNRARFSLSNYQDLKDEHCMIIQGWIKKTLSLSGGKNPEVTYDKSTDSCVFTGTWN